MLSLVKSLKKLDARGMPRGMLSHKASPSTRPIRRNTSRPAWMGGCQSIIHTRELGAALKQGVFLARPGLAFLGLNCAPASVDLQQPAVLAIVAHAAGYKAVVLAKDLRCDQGEGGPVNGITGFNVASLLR
jgi:hypothetical protein